MLIHFYNILGLLMFIWYSCYRWTHLGTSLGKFINGEFILNWWFAPINILTALISCFFVTVSLFDFNYSFKLRYIFPLALFLIARNIWYTLEDAQDFLTKPSYEYGIYIICDISMILYCSIWVYLFKELN